MRRFHVVVTSLTVTLMAVGLSWAIPFLREITDARSAPWVAVAIGLVGSAGLYRFLSKEFLSYFNHRRWVKRLLFGRNDLEGTWIGCYTRKCGEDPQETELIYTVEYFTQHLDAIVIEGKGFKSDGTLHNEWESLAAKVDEEGKKLTYAYECTSYMDKSIRQGVCVLRLERKNPSERPMILHGYSANVVAQASEGENREERVAFDFLPMDEAFLQAKTRF